MHNNNIVEITDFESKELDIYARCNEPELLRGFGRDGGIFIAGKSKGSGESLRCRIPTYFHAGGTQTYRWRGKTHYKKMWQCSGVYSGV